MINLSMTKEAILHNDGKTISSTNGAVKTGQLHGKNEIRLFFNTMYTHKKAQNGLKTEVWAGHYKIPRGKHRQNNLWDKLQQYLFWSISQNSGNKNKNKQMGPT